MPNILRTSEGTYIGEKKIELALWCKAHDLVGENSLKCPQPMQPRQQMPPATTGCLLVPTYRFLYHLEKWQVTEDVAAQFQCERKVIFSVKTGNPWSFTFPLYRMTGHTKRPLHLAILLRLMRSCSLPTCTVLSYLGGRDSGQYTEQILTHPSAKPPQTPWAAIPSLSLEVNSEDREHENTFLRIASDVVQHIWTLFWLLFFIWKDQCTVHDSTIRNWQYEHHR